MFAYASSIYSCRKIERATRDNIYFMWLCGLSPLDHMTINHFRSERVRPIFEGMFSQVIDLLAQKDLISLDTYFLDGTKIETNANKYAFVWKKATEGYCDKLRAKVHRHLEEIDRINEEDALFEDIAQA